MITDSLEPRLVLAGLVESYPVQLKELERSDVDRMEFNIQLLLAAAPYGPFRICDLGGGIGLFAPALAKLGHEVYLVDDFDDPINHEVGESVLDEVHGPAGVNVVRTDLLSFDLRTIAPLDAVTSFDSMEHWHRSPRSTFKSAIAALRPGGTFLLSVPNAANARKRLAVALGKNIWSPMEEWYGKPTFRAHVREAVVADLRYMASDLGLANVRVIGRNWLGYVNRVPWRRQVTPYIDRLLQLRPSLCSDIYLIGQKSQLS